MAGGTVQNVLSYWEIQTNQEKNEEVQSRETKTTNIHEFNNNAHTVTVSFQTCTTPGVVHTHLAHI